MIVTAYGADVRFIEQRRATEFSRSGAFLESGGGLLLGALLFSTTTGILAALGVYHVTGSNGWAVMLGTVPGFILAGFSAALSRGAPPQAPENTRIPVVRERQGKPQLLRT